MTTQLLTAAQAADYLGLHPTTLASWRVQGIGPKYIKIGARNVRYRDSDIETWLEANARSATGLAG